MASTHHHQLCQQFIKRIQNTDIYSRVRDILFTWQSDNKNLTAAISSFKKIAQVIKHKEVYIEDFNKCLTKEAIIPLKQLKQHKQATKDAPHPNTQFRYNEIRPQQPILTNDPKDKTPDLTDSELLQRIQSNKYSIFIIRTMHLYLKCIIGLSQLKALLSPVYFLDAKLYQYLKQLAEDVEEKRRKFTLFAPLNQLVDQRYPMEQIGNSYVRIPDGYANYGKHWSINKLESVLNRKYVSVPLGQQASFKIGKKNEFEQLLIQNQSQKYEIDLGIETLKNCIKIANNQYKVQSSLLRLTLLKLYQNDKIYYQTLIHPILKIKVVIPRLEQKLNELIKARSKFEKQCLEVAHRNFERSLDYRCYYFRKNDKKFNSHSRYERQITLRYQQIQGNSQGTESIQDRESLQKPRNFILNTFDNITKQMFINDEQVPMNYPRKFESTFPKFPQNQILFITKFANEEVLYDVLQILLYHSSKKNLLQLMVFKIMGIIIPKRLNKDGSLLRIIQNIKPQINNENLIPTNTIQLLNDKKDRRNFKDLNEQFMSLIEEQTQPSHLQNIQSPFQGPDNHTFIGTKACYFFVRFLLTIYQRFLRAKQLQNQKNMDQQPQIYNTFLTILIYKVKDPKFNDYLRTLFRKDAFIFLTLDKLITNVSKIMNNINQESLTYKIIKDGTKDYENEIKKWDDFKFPTTYEQIIRLSRQQQTLFRFTYVKEQSNIYISAYENPQHNTNIVPNFTNYISISSFIKPEKQHPFTYVGNNNGEYMTIPESHSLIMKGQELLINKRKNQYTISRLQKQFKRINKLRKIN